MNLWDVDPLNVRPTLVEERRDLLALLAVLSPDQWTAPTEVPGWTVKDLALHILDDDLGWLSRGRDSDSSSLLTIEDPSEFVDALAAKNQRWLDGAAGLSLPVVAGLLEWAGNQMDGYYATLDLAGEGRVAWASDGPVPIWFDIAQDLTERWVHQMQMRGPLDLVGEYRDAYLPLVLRTLAWALPHQLTLEAPTNTTVDVDLGSGGRWHLVRHRAFAEAIAICVYPPRDDLAHRRMSGRPG
ncbi:maleylpyruvate isomerase N-terminal domain-containing protein [Phycicoccus avicenniae]|uniref:maleylpyruvate isomerase N-terminal domain-containing protein n=1 Tax=Phycicoccus avicenniae TaxID=2828860 RepID=UPI003D270DD0